MTINFSENHSIDDANGDLVIKDPDDNIVLRFDSADSLVQYLDALDDVAINDLVDATSGNTVYDTDTETFGDGSQDADLQSVSTVDENVNTDGIPATGVNKEEPLLVGNTEYNGGIAVQAKDSVTSSDDYTQRYPGLSTYGPNGYQMWTLVGDVYEGDPNGSHLSLYTRDAPLGEGGTGAETKRLNIGYGASNVPAAFENVTKLDVRNDDIDSRLSVTTTTDGYQSVLELDPSGVNAFTIRHEPDGDTVLLNKASGAEFRLASGGALDFRENTTYQFVWENGTTSSRPSSPSHGRQYFDSDLGQPIWYDSNAGSWVDAQGNAV